MKQNKGLSDWFCGMFQKKHVFATVPEHCLFGIMSYEYTNISTHYYLSILVSQLFSPLTVYMPQAISQSNSLLSLLGGTRVILCQNYLWNWRISWHYIQNMLWTLSRPPNVTRWTSTENFPNSHLPCHLSNHSSQLHFCCPSLQYPCHH